MNASMHNATLISFCADDISSCTFYFEMLANLHAAAVASKDTAAIESALTEISKRATRLRDPRNLVMVVATLTQRRQIVPAIASEIEARFLGDATALDDLDGHYLASLAYAVAVQGGRNKVFFEALAGRAMALGALEAHDYDNLASAFSTAGVSMPDGVQKEQ